MVYLLIKPISPRTNCDRRHLYNYTRCVHKTKGNHCCIGMFVMRKKNNASCSSKKCTLRFSYHMHYSAFFWNYTRVFFAFSRIFLAFFRITVITMRQWLTQTPPPPHSDTKTLSYVYANWIEKFRAKHEYTKIPVWKQTNKQTKNTSHFLLEYIERNSVTNDAHPMSFYHPVLPSHIIQAQVWSEKIPVNRWYTSLVKWAGYHRV